MTGETQRSRSTDQDATWLVEVPLAAISMDRAWAPAGSTAAVRRAWDAGEALDRQLDPWSSTKEQARDEFAVFHHLGDRLGPPARFVRCEQDMVDTKATASLLLLQDGSLHEALETARAKAHYAIATWALLAPPAPGQLSPAIAVRAPQPDHFYEPAYKRYEENEWMVQEQRHDGAVRQYGAYPLPDDAVLAAPFEAFARLERRPAQALLAGASASYCARDGADAPLAERVLRAQRALLCLCHPAGRGKSGRRWERLAERFEVWASVARRLAYTDEQIAALRRRMRDEADRAAAAGGALLELAPNAAAERIAALEATLLAIGEAMRHTWAAARSADFDDDAFEALFSQA